MMPWIKLKTTLVLGAVTLLVDATATTAFTATNENAAAFQDLVSTIKHETTVIGLVNLDDFKLAILECRDWSPKGNRYLTGRFFLAEGESFEDKDVKDAPVKIAVVRINSTNGTVAAREDGKDMVYRFSTNAETNAVPTTESFRLRDSSLQAVFDLYSKFSGRTLLVHPAVNRQTPVVVSANPRTQAEAVLTLESALREKGLAMIPDGNKFEMILPKELAASANPRSATLAAANTGKMTPPGLIDFENVEFELVSDIYGKLINREILPAGDLPDIRIAFRTSGPLTKSEVVYALEVLFDWQGVKIVAVDDKTSKVVWTNTAWTHPKKRSPAPARRQTAPASERHPPATALPGFKQ